jgi:2-hydroxychromene-2-carboxylate isomerase
VTTPTVKRGSPPSAIDRISGEHMKIVDFYYSIGSRYSYLASTQIDALKQETGCHIEWHPINVSSSSSSPTNGIISGA